jgi:transcriptional regulator
MPMYIPPAFREDRQDVLHDLIRRHSFATLVSATGGALQATHLPFLLDATGGGRGTLRAHMARANPHWQSFASGDEVLVMFQGPHAFVSPAWYETELVVPTWNYVAVHAYGRPRLVEEPGAIRELLEATVRTYEGPAAAGGDAPWSLDRLPSKFVDQLAAAVVAFEIPIDRLEGKLKLGQNRTRADRRGAVAGLRRQGDPLSLAVADLMAEALAEPVGDD